MPFFPKYFKARGTYKAKLLTDAFTGQETAEFVDDVLGVAATGTNVSDITVTVDPTIDDGVVYWNVTNVAWTSVTSSNVGYAVIYLDTGDTATSPLIDYLDARVDNGSGLEGRDIVNDDLTMTVPSSAIRFHVW